MMVERWHRLVGKRSEAVENLVEKGAVRKFAEAIGDANPLYLDEEVAKRSRYGRLLAPPTFPRTFDYGRIENLGSPDIGLLHGEHRIRYERPLFVGEEIRCYTRVTDYREKQGRGGLLVFLITERVGEDTEGRRIFTMEDVAILTPEIRGVVER